MWGLLYWNDPVSVSSHLHSSKRGIEGDQIVDHIVILKLKNDLESERMDSMILNVNSLKTIPGVRSVSTGTGMINDDGRTAVICVQLDSKDALKIYQDHTHHIDVRDNFIKPVVSGMFF